MTLIRPRTAPLSPNRRQLLTGAAALGLTVGLPMRLQAQAAKGVAVSEANHLAMYTSLYVAMRGGYFERHGLQIDLSQAGGIALPVPVVLSGRAKFAVTGPGMSINAAKEGADLVNVAKVTGGVAMWIVARPGSGITSIEDIHDMTIATLAYPSSTIQTPTYAFGKTLGKTPEELNVKFLELPVGAQIQAVVDGRADIATLFEWDVSIATSQFGLESVLGFADVIGPLSWTTAMCTRETLETEPETVQAFCNAMADAQLAVHSDTELFVETSKAEFPGLDESVIRAAAINFLGTPAIPKVPTITPEEWEADMQFELGGGSITEAMPYESRVDNSFATAAVAQAKI